MLDSNSKLFQTEVLGNSAIRDAFNSKTIDKYFMCHSTVGITPQGGAQQEIPSHGVPKAWFDLMKNRVTLLTTYDVEKAITQAMYTNLTERTPFSNRHVYEHQSDMTLRGNNQNNGNIGDQRQAYTNTIC